MLHCLPWRYRATWAPAGFWRAQRVSCVPFFSLWHLIRDALLPTVLFMGSRTRDDNGRLWNHRAFLAPSWRKEVSHVVTGGPRMKLSTWWDSRNTDLSPSWWPWSPVSHLGKSLTASDQSPIRCNARTLSPTCALTGCWWGINAVMTWKWGLYRWKSLSNRVLTRCFVNLDWRLQRLSRFWETVFHPSLLPTQWSPGFLAWGTSFVEDNVSTAWGWRDGFGMTQAHSVYFYYHYISSTSGHPASDPGGWGPPLYKEANHNHGLPRFTLGWQVQISLDDIFLGVYGHTLLAPRNSPLTDSNHMKTGRIKPFSRG